MISDDVICVQTKGGGDNNVESINTPKIDDCLCGLHHV
jgi:hypothetical protein